MVLESVPAAPPGLRGFPGSGRLGTCEFLPLLCSYSSLGGDEGHLERFV